MSAPLVAGISRAAGLIATVVRLTQRRSPSLTWRQIGLAVYLGLNIGMILYQPWHVGFTRDWELWRSLAPALATGDLYGSLGVELPYVWSPFMAPLMAAVGIGGPLPWAALHVAALLTLRDWRLIVLMLCTWGFWTDVAGANTFGFVVIAGALAWRGSRSAALVYLTLLFLMPRPIQVPLALLLLLGMPEIRWPALIIFASHTGLVVASGYATSWIANMLEYGSTTPHDLGPRFFLGAVWVPIAIALAAWFTWWRRPGWAGLFVSAYWLPQYFLMPLIEWRSGPRETRSKPVPAAGGDHHGIL